jgi:hypothetical protein
MAADFTEKSGCNVLKQLWLTALECNIDSPGISGTTGRVQNYVKCSNVRDFMAMATLKCWEERNANELPPIILFDGNTTGKQTQQSKIAEYQQGGKK